MPAPRKIRAIVTDLKHYKDNVTWFRLKPDLRCRFRPGQFLHLALDGYDPSFNWPESRAFSIASSPERQDHLDILVSPKGNFTQRMISEMVLGKVVWLKLPFGIFNFNDAVGRNVILIAGGTGISPYISYLEKLLDCGINYNELHLYYGVREQRLIIYKKLLSECKYQLENFHYNIFVENGNTGDDHNIEKGFMPVSEIVRATLSLEQSIYYLSGPKNMITAFNQTLKEKQIPDNKVIFDRWE